jgi:hypothetical protein
LHQRAAELSDLHGDESNWSACLFGDKGRLIFTVDVRPPMGAVAREIFGCWRINIRPLLMVKTVELLAQFANGK